MSFELKTNGHPVTYGSMQNGKVNLFAFEAKLKIFKTILKLTRVRHPQQKNIVKKIGENIFQLCQLKVNYNKIN